jgi:sporulation protein YlmC with PRC-barrel domain/osmotically-inducible protein OsmY
MNNTFKYLSLTAFAAAMVSSPLSTTAIASEGTTVRDQQRQGQSLQQQQSVRAGSKDSTKPMSSHHTDSQPVMASKVLGMNIHTVADEKIGEINEIFINTGSGEVVAVAVSTGGFLGMGKQNTLVSSEDLRFNGDRTQMHTDISKDQLQNAPDYRKGDTVGLNQVRPMGRMASTRADHMDRSDRMDRQQDTQSYGQDRKLAISDLMGMNVENRQGESIGKVDEVFLNLEKREVVGVVVSTGGFLGLGNRKTLFGMRELSFDSSHEKVLINYNRDQIRAFPEYKENDQSLFDGLRERTDRMTQSTSGYSDSAQATRTGTAQGTRTQSGSAQGTTTQGDSARAQGGSARTTDTARTTDSTRTTDSARTTTDGRGVARTSDATVFDQGNSSAEIAMTASIRTAIRDNDSLSSRANNVTIITNKNKVLLRGEVDSAAEKATVEGIAYSKAGRQNVTSELTVRGR